MTGQVVVLGAGASGMMAALSARETGAAVTLLEPNPKVGRKLYISGKGRCNLTNACTPAEFLQHVVRGDKFLHSAIAAFPPSAVMDYFTALGVPLKVERGSRVFPVSDRAADVIDALYHALNKRGVALVRDRAAALVIRDGRVEAVRGERTTYLCAACVVATGGLSYPATGSTGDGYALAQSAGHTVTPLRGSLVPLEAPGCAAMQGLSLKNVALTLRRDGKAVFTHEGELLFTHFGLSGPLVLSASAHLDPADGKDYAVHIDLKPALTREQLEARLLRELPQWSNRDMGNYALTLVPRLLAPVLLARAGIPEHEKVNSLQRAQRQGLIQALKDLAFPVAGPRSVAEAIVTAGGVALKEVDPKTMGSKLCEGLYLAGEVLDADAYTGGFNLQIAWCTGRRAGLSAGEYSKGGGQA